MASIGKYGDGWRAQIYVAGERDSRTFRTQREARAWADARENELRKAPAQRYTVRDLLERYADEISSKKAGARFEGLRITALLREHPDLADMLLADVKTPHIAAWRDARLRMVTPATVQRDINWLRNAFKVGREEWRWMDGNPFTGLRMPSASAPRTRRVSVVEVRRICRALHYRTGAVPKTTSQQVALAFLIGLRTAMRAGEILSLGRGCLDLNQRVARVQHKMQYLTGRPRDIPLTRQAVRLLRPVAEQEKCFTLSSAVLEATFRRARDRLLIEDLHFHDSRAEALTRLARKVDVMTLARISGHADIRILQRVYYRESAADIAARL